MPVFDEMPIAVMTPVEDAIPEEEVTRVEAESGQGSEKPFAGPPEDAEPVTEVAPEAASEQVGPASSSPPEPARAASEAPSPPPVLPETSDEDLWEEPPQEPEPRVKPPSTPAPPGELPQRRVVVIDENPDRDIEATREEPAPPPGATDVQQEGLTDIGGTLDDDRGRKRRWRMFRKGGE